MSLSSSGIPSRLCKTTLQLLSPGREAMFQLRIASKLWCGVLVECFSPTMQIRSSGIRKYYLAREVFYCCLTIGHILWLCSLNDVGSSWVTNRKWIFWLVFYINQLFMENYLSALNSKHSVCNHAEYSTGYCIWAFEIIPWDSGDLALKKVQFPLSSLTFWLN